MTFGGTFLQFTVIVSVILFSIIHLADLLSQRVLERPNQILMNTDIALLINLSKVLATVITFSKAVI